MVTDVIAATVVLVVVDNVIVTTVNVKRRKDRGTISIPEASPKEKEKAVSIAVGTVKGTVQGMGAATKGGKYHWAGSKDSKW